MVSHPQATIDAVLATVIDAVGHLNLPSPCLAPIAFVTNGIGDPPGVWFSITGA